MFKLEVSDLQFSVCFQVAEDTLYDTSARSITIEFDRVEVHQVEHIVNVYVAHLYGQRVVCQFGGDTVNGQELLVVAYGEIVDAHMVLRVADKRGFDVP